MAETEKFILLAEDDAVVAEIVLHALGRCSPPPRIVHVRDGVEALDFLRARPPYDRPDRGSPAVVLLDIKMPRLDGLEVLREVRADAALKTTPIVMLTSSQDEHDVETSYLLGANAYVVKPLEFKRLAEVLAGLESFWLEINHRPSAAPERPALPS